MPRPLPPLISILAICGAPCLAQHIFRAIPTPCQWLDGQMLITIGETRQVPGLLVKEVQTRRGVVHELRPLPMPPPSDDIASSRIFYVINSEVFRIDSRWDHPQPNQRSFATHQFHDHQWHQVSSLNCPQGKTQLDLVPLANGKVLVFDSNRDAKALVTIYRPDGKGELGPERTVDLGQPFQVLKPHLYTTFFGSWPRVVTDRYVLVLHPPSGYWWAFSLENGDLRRQGKLFEEIEDKHLATPNIPLILAVHPLPDGDVMLVSRDPAYVTESAKEIASNLKFGQDLSATPPDIQNAMAFAKKREWERDMLHPFLRWFRFSAEGGRFKPLKHPPIDGPEIVNSPKDLESARTWLPSGDGERVFPRALILDTIQSAPKPVRISKER